MLTLHRLYRLYVLLKRDLFWYFFLKGDWNSGLTPNFRSVKCKVKISYTPPKIDCTVRLFRCKRVVVRVLDRL